MPNYFRIGTMPDGPGVICLETLLESRLLIQGNSGGGKSWCLRRLLEVSFGMVQHLVIDIEDEFFTLREAHDYVLAGRAKDGDCPANPQCASLLARKLLDARVSAVVSIAELHAYERQRFVRLFLEQLIATPPNQPVIVVLDEAHIFCPETGKHRGRSEAAESVIDLMTRGRKRFLCGILATQRISKLHKDAAAEANNKLIGRCTLDVDMKRAADELGLSSREQTQQLRALRSGEFFVFGPAFTNPAYDQQPGLIKVGAVQTTHGRSAQPRSAAALKPSKQLKKALAELSSLPAEAAEETQTVEALKQQISDLKAKLAAQPVDKSEYKLAAFKKAFSSGVETAKSNFMNQWRASVQAQENLNATLFQALDRLQEPHTRIQYAAVIEAPPGVSNTVKTSGKEEELSKAARVIGSALKAHGACTRSKAAYCSQYSVRSSTFKNAVSELNTAGFIRKNGRKNSDVLELASESFFPNVEVLNSYEDFWTYWRNRLEKAPLAMLNELKRVLPFGSPTVLKSNLAEATGYSEKSSTFKNALSTLRVCDLIEQFGDGVSLSKKLIKGDWHVQNI